MASGGGSSSASEHGALRASAQSRSRSYGSTARLPTSPGRRQEHRLRPGDTLAGLALHYGVNTEQIRRENRLHTNDSIFLKDVLWIPAVGKEYVSRMESNTEGARSLAGDTETEPDPELSATEFLRRLDARITQSKAAALQKLREEGDRWVRWELPLQCYTAAVAPGTSTPHRNCPGHPPAGRGGPHLRPLTLRSDVLPQS
ncbi:lysM and putative peptidoglycan-binding domain-containing protein 1 isoform X2 [Narcine bancroftii]|uniref:lysM and putative peptidoglycan-binding domain-containing protein 1 isoform X2 n=1 Tax=Narcine bancroftii TaxID=1343680 RepID=UPI003831C006